MATESDRLTQVTSRRPKSATPPRLELASVFAATVVALVMVHWVMLRSGFRLVQDSPYDTRGNHFVMEHEYRWMRGDPGHKSLFDPPVFYPIRGTLTYGDVLLSYALPYAAVRALGASPESAYQAWLIFTTVVNVVAASLFFHRVVRAPPIAATVGTLLFCVVGPRLHQFDHPQLYPQVFLLLVAASVVRILGDGARPDAQRFTIWPSVLALALALQAWGGFYLLFFTLLVLFLGIVAGTATRVGRAMISGTIRRCWPSLVTAGALFVVLVAPLALRYREALVQVGGRSYAGIVYLLPRPQSWFYPGASWLWGWTTEFPIFRELPSGEHVMGFGVLTILIGLAGLWLKRQEPIAQWLVIMVGLIVILSTVVAGHSLWRLMHLVVPGANAIRAVARIWLVCVVPLALAVAAVIGRLERRGYAVAAVLLGALCVGEQLYPKGGYDKVQVRAEVERITHAIPPTARTFFVSVSHAEWEFRPHYDAMWAALEAGLPTINGGLPNYPRGYDLITVAQVDLELAEDERRLRTWCEKNGLSPAEVAWVHDEKLRPIKPGPDTGP